MNSDMTKYCYQHFENAYNIGWNTNFDSTVESKETFNLDYSRISRESG